MAKWEDAWIETAHAIVREEFDRKYAFMDINNEADQQMRHEDILLLYMYHFNLELLAVIHIISVIQSFDNLPALSTPASLELCDEINRYLSSDLEQVTDIFQWWYERRGTYPHLHRMALDYLAIPGEYLLIKQHLKISFLIVHYYG
jgi:hypothetical protein